MLLLVHLLLLHGASPNKWPALCTQQTPNTSHNRHAKEFLIGKDFNSIGAPWNQSKRISNPTDLHNTTRVMNFELI